MTGAYAAGDPERIAKAPGKAKRSGRGWVGRCPCHDDREPSSRRRSGATVALDRTAEPARLPRPRATPQNAQAPTVATAGARDRVQPRIKAMRFLAPSAGSHHSSPVDRARALLGGALDDLERLSAEPAERHDALDSIADRLMRACQHARDEQAAIETRAAADREAEQP